MRRLTALTLSAFLLAAAPAAAALGDEFGSEQQTEGYGKLFGYVCAAVSVIGVLIGGYIIFKGMHAEATRGKKARVIEDVLDDPVEKQKLKAIVLYLGEKVPDWKLANRLPATKAALKFLARTDDGFDRKKLVGVAEKAFRGVKAALEERSGKALERYVGDAWLENMLTEIRGHRKKGERHVLSPLDVLDVQVVQFEAPAGLKNHSFTALVSAASRDYYEDDRTGKRLRGDKKTYEYQEFWRFQRVKGGWLVDRIRPAADMDTVLAATNVLTPATLDAFAKDAEEGHLREFVAK